MKIRPFVLALPLAAALPLLAQTTNAQQPAVYVQAYYSKWKPGMAEEGRKFLTEVANKRAAAIAKGDPANMGQVRLYRVFPSAAETGHDSLRLVFHNALPDLGGTGTPAAYLAGTGLTPAEYSRKINSLNTTVKYEIWTSVFRYGSLSEGDFVRVNYLDPPKDHSADFTAFQREYGSGMAAHLVQDGSIKGWEQWRLLLTPNAAPYNFVSYTVHKDSAGALKGLGRQTDAFYAAHPKGDYNRYLARGRELSNTVKTVIYRVDSAIWK